MKIITIILLFTFSALLQGSDKALTNFIVEFESSRFKGVDSPDIKDKYVKSILGFLENGNIKGAFIFKQSLTDEKIKKYIESQLFYETGYISKLCDVAKNNKLNYYIALCEYVVKNYSSARQYIKGFENSYLNKLIISNIKSSENTNLDELSLLNILNKYEISAYDRAYFYNEYLGVESAKTYCNNHNEGQCKHIKIVTLENSEEILKLLGSHKDLSYYENISVVTSLIESKHSDLYEMMSDFGFTGCEGFYYECIYIKASLSLWNDKLKKYKTYHNQMLDMWPTNPKNELLDLEYAVVTCMEKPAFSIKLENIIGVDTKGWFAYYEKECLKN